MARTKNQGARREALIEAAGRAIAERGLAGLRIRDIAEAAGVSPGSVLYYYPELDDLVFEVHRDAVERYLTGRRSATDDVADPVERLAAAIRSGVPAGPDDPVHRLLYELHALAERGAAHAALMAQLNEREVALYTTILEVGAAVGVFTLVVPARAAARNLVALEDGYGVQILSRNPGVAGGEAFDLIADYAWLVTGRHTPLS